MAKRSFTRREFLKISALSSTALALGSCASLDRSFRGEKRDLVDEVVILGAGAAGLAAAYTLKKNKIPYRMFEASSRVGGRVQSLTLFPQQGAVAELGAEFIEESHSRVFALAKEFNLNLSEIKTVPKLEAHLFSFNGQVYRVSDLTKRMKSLTAPVRRLRADLYRQQDALLNYKNNLQFERSSYYDSLSLQDLLTLWSSEVDPLILKLIETQCVARFGVDADSQSALHFIETLDAEGSSLLSGRRLYRMEGGLTSLMTNIYERVAGVIPEYLVKTQHALSEVTEQKGVFSLTFNTPQGQQSYSCRQIICTIPFSKFREVKGLQDLQLSKLKKDAILSQDYATHSKGVIVFDEPFWKKKQGMTPAHLGNFTGDFKSQKMWDSGRAQETQKGLLTFQRAGKSGAAAGASAGQEAFNDLSLFYTDLSAHPILESQLVNWSQRSWAQGSMAYFKKGQYMRFKGVAAEPEYDGKFVFAGEHTSLRYAGTLQGAVDSGVAAANSMLGLSER